MSDKERVSVLKQSFQIDHFWNPVLKHLYEGQFWKTLNCRKSFFHELNFVITLLKWFIFFIVFEKFVVFVILIISDINTVKRCRQPKRTSLEKAFLLESEANIMTPVNWKLFFALIIRMIYGKYLSRKFEFFMKFTYISFSSRI